MKRHGYLITIFVGFALALGVVGGATAQSGGPVSQEGVGAQAALGTGFTYQGQLKSSGSPVSDTCVFGFGLWDAASGGVQLGVTQTVTTTVTGGLFTATLNDSGQFGGSAFSGSNARYLGIGVKCGSESNLTNLGRQALNAAPYALYARNNWGLNGNSTSASNFLGTTNNMTLTLAVSNTAALRLVPNATSPNVIGGWSGNTVSSGVAGATIGGGGASGFTNTVSASHGTVSGGYSNTADGLNATVSGGADNVAGNDFAVIAGGGSNTANGLVATISGGYDNTASNEYAAVGGGNHNEANGELSTVSGGLFNVASGNYATIPGGLDNTASGIYSFAAGYRTRHP